VTDFSAIALDTDPQGLDTLRSVLGHPKRLPLGASAMRAAASAAEVRSAARRRAHARRELRATA
jgi:hypothetical protein